MPWVTGADLPRGLKGRERSARYGSAPGEGSRGPSGRMIVAAVGSQGVE
jgi:hypothetical protein